jgi:acetyl-CoA acetyltransferase
MQPVFILGVGMTPFGRHREASVRSLAEQAVREALDDAGIAPEAVGAIAFGNAVQDAMEGQFGIRGQVALRNLPFDGVPVINVENACASASTALQVAILQVRSGEADIALAVGSEKMTHPDSALSLGAFEGSWERADREATLDRLRRYGEGMPTPPEDLARESKGSVFMDVYAAYAKAHMARFGTTQRQLAVVAAKNHRHSVENPRAQYRTAFSVEEVLGARLISWPMTLPMCSPISDGAAAAVVASEAAVRRLGAERAVRVRANVLMTGGRRGPEAFEEHVARRAALRAYDLAGLGPEAVDVVECHDATSFGELQMTELLGLCPIGEGGAFAESGATALGGRVPVNPSGGLESKGHPIGATGLGMIHELVTQLRGEAGPRQVEGARVAMAENGGGQMGYEEAVVSVTLLERAD